MTTFEEQYNRVEQGHGFIAALDQSGGSTPKALLHYGIQENQYKSEEEMFRLIQEMRVRIMTDKSFSWEKIIGVILFEQTMNESINGVPIPEYLWKEKIVSFLKVDKGLEKRNNDVQLMKEIPNLAARIRDAKSKLVFGTKMRSVIYANNNLGIADVVKQQFDLALTILDNGLIPVVEPEIDIHAIDKMDAEKTLKECIITNLQRISSKQRIVLKLTLPTENNFYIDLINHPKILRVFALSGGYEIEVANTLLSKNNGMIASFSRALLEDLRVNQSAEEFSKVLSNAIESIYKASIT